MTLYFSFSADNKNKGIALISFNLSPKKLKVYPKSLCSFTPQMYHLINLKDCDSNFRGFNFLRRGNWNTCPVTIIFIKNICIKMLFVSLPPYYMYKEVSSSTFECKFAVCVYLYMHFSWSLRVFVFL